MQFARFFTYIYFYKIDCFSFQYHFVRNIFFQLYFFQITNFSEKALILSEDYCTTYSYKDSTLATRIYQQADVKPMNDRAFFQISRLYFTIFKHFKKNRISEAYFWCCTFVPFFFCSVSSIIIIFFFRRHFKFRNRFQN